MKFAARYRALVGEAGSLRFRTLSAVGWSFGGTSVQRGLSLASNLIMTRFLMPEAFGLMAMVVTVMAMVNMISDIGIRQSITRDKRGDDLHFLQVAWTIQILRSLVIAATVVAFGVGLGFAGPALAPPDSVYADPQLPGLICASALAIVFQGLQSTAVHNAARNLQLRKVTMIATLNQAITLVVMVGLVQIHATVWVLLLGMLIGSGQHTIWTHTAFRSVPMRFAWDRDIAGDMWQFGRWLILSSAAGFIVNQGDRFLLGAFLDSETFGLYVIAALWLQNAAMVLEKVTGQVVFSGFSETLRERRDQFPRYLARVRWWIDLFLITSFVGLFFGAPFLIGFLYTPEYAGAAGFLSILSLRFIARRQQILGSVLLAEGDSHLMAASISISALALVAGVPLTYYAFGIEAAVAVVALAPLAGSFLLVRAAKRKMPEIKIRADVVWAIAVLVMTGIVLSMMSVSNLG